MELRLGYKVTEVGVIPEDWRSTSLAEEVDLLTGFPFPSAGYVDSGVRLLRGSNVKRGLLDWTDAITKYWPAVTPDIARYELREGDLVIAMDGALVGRSYAIVSSADLPSLLLQRVARIRSSRVHQQLLVFWVGSDAFVQHVDLVKTHTAIPHISPLDIRKFALAVPRNPTEQRAIAEALSEVDALLAKLDALIAKKRDLKQAAMQQLLTGQTRLPRFSGEWEVKRFDELFHFLNTANNPRADLSEFGDVGYIHYGDIHTSTATFLDCAAQALPLIAKNRVANIPLVQDGDLVMADASEDYEGIGKCMEIRNVTGRRIVAGLHTFLLRGNRDLITNGFKGNLHFIPSVKAALVRFATGISVYGISKNNVRSIEVLLPSIEEQTAIATVLSDMDTEIAALEARLAKTAPSSGG